MRGKACQKQGRYGNKPSAAGYAVYEAGYKGRKRAKKNCSQSCGKHRISSRQKLVTSFGLPDKHFLPLRCRAGGPGARGAHALAAKMFCLPFSYFGRIVPDMLAKVQTNNKARQYTFREMNEPVFWRALCEAYFCSSFAFPCARFPGLGQNLRFFAQGSKFPCKQ